MTRRHPHCAAAHLRGLMARLLLVALAAAAPVFTGARAANSGVTEEAILRGDWPTLTRAADGGQDPATTMVRGHALLALNRNDESVCHFAGADAAALRSWDEWTRAFLQRNPAHPVAAYLRGDALARLGQRDAAIEQFTLGLRARPSDRMLLNARGVAFALGGKWDHALLDFKVAEAEGGLADAAANLGVTGLLQGQTADAVAAHFDRALKLSPRFALARAGRATARLAQRKPELAQADADAVAKSEACIPALVGRAIGDAITAFNARGGPDLASLDAKALGTTLEVKFGALERGDMRAMNDIARIVSQHPEYAPVVRQRLDQIGAAKPELAGKMNDKIRSGQEWTSATGGANSFLKTFGGLTAHAEVSGSHSKGPAADRTTVTGTAGGTWSAKPLADQQVRNTAADHRAWDSIAPAATRPGVWPEGKNGGASSRSNQAHWDLNDGPMIAVFGLYYSPVGTPKN